MRYRVMRTTFYHASPSTSTRPFQSSTCAVYMLIKSRAQMGKSTISLGNARCRLPPSGVATRTLAQAFSYVSSPLDHQHQQEFLVKRTIVASFVMSAPTTPSSHSAERSGPSADPERVPSSWPGRRNADLSHQLSHPLQRFLV